MKPSILESELAPLNTQIEKVEQKREALESELRVVEAEINKFSADRQRFDALQDVCNALDKLSELKADELFWEGIPEAKDAAGHVEQVRSRVARFEGEISGILEKQASYQEQINHCLDELQILDEEVRDAYDREERRKEEFVVEREISTVPYRAIIMPWTKEAESESRFRRAILVALILCFVFGAPIPLIKIPIPDRSDTVVEIPKRLVQLVKEDLPKPAPVKKPVPKQAKEKPKPTPDKQHKPDKEPKGGGPAKKQTKLATAKGGGAAAARKTANHVGVLKFKDAFAGLMNETPVAKLGTEARLSNKSFRVKGQAVAQRSLVAIQGKGGSSGGISNFGVSRNIGNGNVGRLGGGGGSGIGDGSGVGFVRVESAIAGLEESSRPTK